MTMGIKEVGDLHGGDPILAFTNTVQDTGKTRVRDSFENSEDLIRELRDSGLRVMGLPPGQAQLRTLMAFREATYGVLSALAAGRPANQEDTLLVQMAIKSAIADAELDLSDGFAVWKPGPLGGLQDALALHLAALLSSHRLRRLRECRRCTRLFLDHGRGPGRKWCSMATCGNRAKIEAYRARQNQKS